MGTRKMTNKFVRFITGGEWIHVRLHDGKLVWLRPTFPECTKKVCEFKEDEKYPHSFGPHQMHMTQ